jgi:ArsR family transcriptional regulator
MSDLKSLSRADAQVLAGVVKVLADPARLQLLALLSAHGELPVKELADTLGRLSHPQVSSHLQILLAAGFVTRRRDWPWQLYRLERSRFAEVAAALTGGRR